MINNFSPQAFLANVPLLPAAGEAEVTLPTAKGVVASRLNLTQEHFSRILRDLTVTGLIEVRGPTLRIFDVGRLRELST